MTTPNVFIATPMFMTMCHAEYMASVIRLTHVFRSHKMMCTFNYITKESTIEKARNELVRAFLDSDATHLLFIDADVTFDADQVFRMLAADTAIVAGMYPKKAICWDRLKSAIKAGVPESDLKYAAYDYSFVSESGVKIKLDENRTDLIEVDAAGTGMMLIKREVFEAVKPLVESYLATNGVCKGKEINYFFKAGVHRSLFMTEDTRFCFLWRRTGGQVFVAPWVLLQHTGNYEFGVYP
jgi:hypothetical protein